MPEGEVAIRVRPGSTPETSAPARALRSPVPERASNELVRTATSGWLLFPAVCFLLVLPFTHTIAARLLFLAASGVCAVIAWRRWGTPPLPGGLKIVWLAYSGWAVLSVLWSLAPAYSLAEVKDEIGYTLIAFLAFWTLVRSRRDGVILHAAILSAFAVCTAMGLYKVAMGDGWDGAGVHGGSNNYSVWLVMLAPAVVWLIFITPSRRWRYGLSGLAAFFLIGAFFAEQRATWPVLGGEAVLLSGLLLWRQPWTLSRKMAITGLVAVLALLVTPIGVAKRMGVTYVEAVQSLDRMVFEDVRPRDIWQASRQVIRQHAVIGAGFGRIIASQAYPEMNLHRAWHAHNIVLNRAVQLGWIGTILFLVLMGGMVVWLFRTYRQTSSGHTAVLAACALTSVVGLLAVNMTNDAFVRHTSLLFWSLMGMWLAMLVRPSESTSNTTYPVPSPVVYLARS